MTQLSVIIVVYNEHSTVEEVIHKVEAVSIDGMEKEILIVDDCSTDGTRDVLKKYEDRYDITYHPKNTGKGGAVRTGFSRANGDYVIVQDADVEQNPQDFPALLQPILDGKADVTFGSRFAGKYLPDSLVMSVHYKINRFFTIVCNLLTGYRTTDMWTGYKMYTRKAIDAIHPHLTSTGIEIEPEVTILLSKTGFRVVDVPITYVPRWYDEGKKTNWKQAIRSFMKMIGFSCRRIPGETH